MTLAALQRVFFTAATQPGQGQDVERHFVGTAALSASERVAIYGDMFLWRQVDSLREDFPKLAALHDDFYALAQAYLMSHPSRHPSLAQLGRHMPAFVAEHGTQRGELADLATLEWARAEVFEEADAEVITQPAALGEPFCFVPALRILHLAHDASALWQAVEDGVSAPGAARVPTTVVVWRKDYEVFHARLDELEAEALRRAVRGERIEAICEAFEHAADPVRAALSAIGSWFAEGYIAAPRGD